MPKLNTFRINNKGTLKNIMNPAMKVPETSQQGRMEKDIMKYLMKQSKKDALAELWEKKPLKSVKQPSKARSKTLSSDKPNNPTSSKKSPHIEKEEAIDKIIKYQTNIRFGPIITKELGFKYTRTQLSKQSIDQLETILHRIRTHLNSRNMDQVFEHMAKITAKGYEELVTGFGYNIEGFQQLLFENPAFHDAFERWKIEKKIPDVPPSFQLMYIVASTTYIAHLQNQHLVKTKDIKKEPLQKPQIKKDKDEPRLKSNL